MNKPQIVVLSNSNDNFFSWASVDWNRIGHENQTLMKKARAAIRRGKTYAQVIRNLESAGFEIVE